MSTYQLQSQINVVCCILKTSDFQAHSDIFERCGCTTALGL